MAHAKHAVDQVEFQLLDAGQLAQLVLNQGLLGRAVHGVDTETAELGVAAGLLAQLHQCRRGFRAAATVAVVDLAMGVIVIVLVFVADRLVHGVILKLSLLPSEHPVATIGSSHLLEIS